MEGKSRVVEYTSDDAQILLDKYALKNIPGITYLNNDGSPLHHEVFSLSLNPFFSEEIDKLDGVQGRHLLSYSTMRGQSEFSPLLRVLGSKSSPNYINNITKFLELLTDGSVPMEIVERYINHYIKSDSYMLEIGYKPVAFYGRMDGEYIKLLGQYGFNPNLPIITFDRTSGTFTTGINSLGLIDEDVGKYNGDDDDLDNYEDIYMTRGQKAALEALTLGANMQHRPESMMTKTFHGDNKTHVNFHLRPVRQLYPPTFFSDKGYRHSLPQGDRLASFNLYKDEEDRQQMEKRLPTTYLLQQLELLKPEQKLALAKFFEQTGVEGVDQLFYTLEEISRHHDSMNPYVTRDASGRSMNTRYLMDKQRGGKGSKKTKKKQRGGGTRSKKRGRRSKKKTR